jgi:hypothetical protein
MATVTQSDRITYAALRLDSSFDWWTIPDVEEVLKDEYGDDAPSTKTVRNRIKGLEEVDALERMTRGKGFDSYTFRL